MRLVQTTLALTKADDADDIDDASFEVLARKVIGLVAAAGWGRRAAIARLIRELEEEE